MHYIKNQNPFPLEKSIGIYLVHTMAWENEDRNALTSEHSKRTGARNRGFVVCKSEENKGRGHTDKVTTGVLL